MHDIASNNTCCASFMAPVNNIIPQILLTTPNGPGLIRGKPIRQVASQAGFITGTSLHLMDVAVALPISPVTASYSVSRCRAQSNTTMIESIVGCKFHTYLSRGQ